MTKKITIEPFGHDKEDDGEMCVVCGRKAGRYIALVLNDMTFGDPDEIGEDHPDNMGWWPIGSSCKKKLPKHYVREA